MLKFADRNPQLPPRDLVPVEEIAQAFERWADASAAAKLAVNAIDELERERVKAEHADDQATADALEQGLKDPGPKHTAAIERKLEDARRKARATGIVQQRAFEALQQTYADHGTTWIQQLAGTLDETRDAYLAAIETLRAAHLRLAQVENAAAFAAGRVPFGSKAWRMQIPAPRLLDGPGFGSLTVSDTLDALASLAEPPKPREKVERPLPRPFTLGTGEEGTNAEFQRMAANGEFPPGSAGRAILEREAALAGEAAGAMLVIPGGADDDE